MNPKRVISIALTAVVLVSVGYVIYAEGAKSAAPADPAAAEPNPAEASAGDAVPIVYAYYFHGNQRCDTCRSIEANMRRVIQEDFAKELDTGSLVLASYNTDKPEHEHFIKDFELAHNGVVLVVRQGDEVLRFEELTKVWDLAGEPERMRDFISETTMDFLGSAAS